MPYETVTKIRCTLCGDWVASTERHDNECPESPQRKAEAAAWEANFQRVESAWRKWEEETGKLRYAIPSVNHLPNEVAIECGRLKLELNGNRRGVRSAPMRRPTWAQVIRWFDQAIPKVKDFHHVFLEGVTLIANQGPDTEEGQDLYLYEVLTGS